MDALEELLKSMTIVDAASGKEVEPKKGGKYKLKMRKGRAFYGVPAAVVKRCQARWEGAEFAWES